MPRRSLSPPSLRSTLALARACRVTKDENAAGEGGEASTQFEQVSYEDALGDPLEELRIVA